MAVNKKLVLSCIILSLLLCLSQIMGSTMLILACLGAYLLLLAWGCMNNQAFLILLYFLPWSPLMRISPSSYSFYTFGLVLACSVNIILNNIKLKKYAVIAGILITLTTLISKSLDNSDLTFYYIIFLMMIVLFPAIQEENRTGEYAFYQVVVFLSLGVIVASLCALNYAEYANIRKYIRVDEYQTIIRRSGFYGDANFYVAQILAALGGALPLVLQEKKYPRVIFLMVIIFCLLYCGFLSGSKSFALISIMILLMWMVALLKKRGQRGLKLIVLSCFVGVAAYIATSALFSGLIEVILTRFSRSRDFNSFTTGRARLWGIYIEKIFGSFKVLLLGTGYTNVMIDGRASHSTVIQFFYQFGLLGAPVMIYWIISFFRSNLQENNKQKFFSLNQLTVFVGAFIPWLALDMLFFDEFFLIQWYMLASLKQYAGQSKDDCCDQKRITVKFRW